MRRSQELPPRCPKPTHELLQLLTRPWTMHILWVLSTSGPTRFGALRRQIDGISSRLLTERLRDLEEKGFIYRRLIRRVQAEHLDELNALIENNEPCVTLDLTEVSLVDVDAVRFLGACRSKGVKLTGCSPYIRDWIALELGREH